VLSIVFKSIDLTSTSMWSLVSVEICDELGEKRAIRWGRLESVLLLYQVERYSCLFTVGMSLMFSMTLEKNLEYLEGAMLLYRAILRFEWYSFWKRIDRIE